MKTAILALTYCAMLSVSADADNASPIATPDEMIRALTSATTVEITGNPPFDPWTMKPVLRYPVRLQRSAGLRQLAEFFRQSPLRLDEEATRAFRDGARIGSNEVSIITIDGKHSFHILSIDKVIFADHLTYTGPETPGPLDSWFHRDFALTLKHITSGSAKARSKKHTATLRCSELLRASQPVLPPPRCARPQPPFRTGSAALRGR